MRSLFKNLQILAIIAVALGLPATSALADTENYSTTLSGANEVPPNASTAAGEATLTVDTVTLEATWTLEFSGLSAAQTGAHFHNAPAGSNGGVVFALPMGSPVAGNWSMSQADYDELAAGNIYVNVHTEAIPSGEIRGQMAIENVGAESTTLGAVKDLFR